MEEKKIKIPVDIYGEKFTLKGGHSAQDMRNLADYVDRKMQQIGTRNTRLSKSHVAILTALNIADELQKLQDDYDSLMKIMENDNGKKEEKAGNTKNHTVKKMKQMEMNEAHGL